MSIDAFTIVKKKIDDLVADLEKEQAADVKKYDMCQTNMNDLKKKKNDLKLEQTDLERNESLATTKSEELATKLETLDKEKTEAHKELADASAERNSANAGFQKEVDNETDMQKALWVAIARMEKYYDQEAYNKKADMFLQRKAHSRFHFAGDGAPAELKQGGYAKQDSGKAVIGLLQQVMKDSEENIANLKKAEQEGQIAYEAFVAETNSLVEAKDTALANSEAEKADTDEEIAETKKHIRQTSEEMEATKTEYMGLKLDCEVLLTKFDQIQTRRAEDIEALKNAKSVLSGALQSFE
jgi:chromosome segregation ATPase